MNLTAILEAFGQYGVPLVLVAIVTVMLYGFFKGAGVLVKNFLERLSNELFDTIGKLKEEQTEIKEDVNTIKENQEELKEHVEKLSDVVVELSKNNITLIQDIKATTDLTRELNNGNVVIIQANTSVMQEVKESLAVSNTKHDMHTKVLEEMVRRLERSEGRSNKVLDIFTGFNKDLYETINYMVEVMKNAEKQIENNKLFKEFELAKNDDVTYSHIEHFGHKHVLQDRNVKFIRLLTNFYNLTDEEQHELINIFEFREEENRINKKNF